MSSKDSAGAPELIRGSVVVHRRRCGKPNCRCAAGDLHEATVLSYSERGRTRFVMLPQAESFLDMVPVTLPNRVSASYPLADTLTAKGH